MMESTAILDAVTHILCCSCAMCFSAAASSEKDQGSMNFASNTAPRREPNAVTLIHQLLTGAGKSMDGLTADALAERLDVIERIDRLTTIAESRRNVSLHEI